MNYAVERGTGVRILVNCVTSVFTFAMVVKPCNAILTAAQDTRQQDKQHQNGVYLSPPVVPWQNESHSPHSQGIQVQWWQLLALE